jgi:hypothetical protein
MRYSIKTASAERRIPSEPTIGEPNKIQSPETAYKRLKSRRKDKGSLKES